MFVTFVSAVALARPATAEGGALGLVVGLAGLLPSLMMMCATLMIYFDI